jgi:signal transduction histidine kinase
LPIDRRLLMHGRLSIEKAGDGVIGDEPGHLLRRLRAFGAEPVSGPVQRTEECARRDRRIVRTEHAAANAGGHQRADAALVAVALGDDAHAEPRRKGVDLEMRGGALDLVDQAQHVRNGDGAEPAHQRPAVAAGGAEGAEQAIERAILAEEEELVLAAEIVIEVAGRQLRGERDVAHARRREAARAEHPARGAHDLDPAGLRAFRTAVRKVNHGSILAHRRRVRKGEGPAPGAVGPGRKKTVTTGPSARSSYNIGVMRWAGYLAAVGTVAGIVTGLRLASISSDGVAATLLLLDVVIIARWFSFGPALTTAAVGAGCYSYFFLPPAGFAIETPEDWFGFIAFTVTAVIASELSARAQRRAAEAQAGRQEIERLYQELQGAFERASEAEAARRSEQLKAALLDALTHNLRTPLTSIKAAVTALIGSAVWNPQSDLSTEGRRELLQVIDEESDRLNRFIEGLSTPDHGEPLPPIHLRAVDVGDVIRSGLHRAETVTRDHRMIVALDEKTPAVSIDAASIAEVMYILLDNASKYAAAGTTISVESTPLDERQVRIRVVDQGPGIPEHLRERVFEKFFRVPARESHDPNRGGIGLGLPIARRLVETQGGRIWIETPASGRGTAVVMTLPVAVEGADVERREQRSA